MEVESPAKERALAELRQQIGKDKVEEIALKVLERLVESETAFDPVGTIGDEVGGMYMYAVNKRALLSEFCGGIFSYVVVNRIEGVDPALGLYMTHLRERIGVFLEEELELCFERIVDSLHAGEDKRFGKDAHDG